MCLRLTQWLKYAAVTRNANLLACVYYRQPYSTWYVTAWRAAKLVDSPWMMFSASAAGAAWARTAAKTATDPRLRSYRCLTVDSLEMQIEIVTVKFVFMVIIFRWLLLPNWYTVFAIFSILQNHALIQVRYIVLRLSNFKIRQSKIRQKWCRWHERFI